MRVTRRAALMGAAGAGAAMASFPMFSQSVTARSDAPSRAIDAMFLHFTEPGSPGAAVGVYHRGQAVHVKGYGLADLECNRPITPDTVFHIASVSKQFCAFALALLIEQGKVGLEADIREYLPYVPDTGAMIRVRHLVHHMSGLRDHGAYWMLAGRDFQDFSRTQPFLNVIARPKPLNFAPGSDFQYNNTNYTLLAQIVERVSGRSFRQYCADNIFRPLGMDSTFFHDDVRELVKNRAHSYAHKGAGWGRTLLSFEYVGATGLNTTINDMMRWADNLLGKPKVGNAALINSIMAPVTLDDGRPNAYGFGLNRTIHNGRVCIMHNGADASFNTVSAYFPQEQLGIVVFQNTDGARHESMITVARAIADVYLDGKRIGEDEVPVDAALLASAPGDYLNPFYRLASVQARDGALYLGWARNPSSRLRHLGNGKFADAEAFSATYTFTRSPDGGIATLTRREQMMGAAERVFARVAAVNPTPAALREFEGDYYNPEVQTTWRIGVENGRITARCMWSAAPIVFSPASADRFDSNGISMSVIEFQRDSAGRVNGLMVHSSRMNNVWLQRVDPASLGPMWGG